MGLSPNDAVELKAHLADFPSTMVDDDEEAKLYNPRYPERTRLYQTVAVLYETWQDQANFANFGLAGLRGSRSARPKERHSPYSRR